MERPWITPEAVRNYTQSDKVKARSDEQLSFDIARAERYVIFHTHNKFNTAEYESALPSDVTMAVTLLAESYAKQVISQKDGTMKSETFDDYSYTIDTDSDIAEQLGLGALLEDYVLDEKSGKIVFRMRRL